MNKLHKSEVEVDHLGRVRVNPPSQLNCSVCKARYGTPDWKIWIIHKSNLVEIGNYYYVVPKYHEQCVELFALNPLAYE